MAILHKKTIIFIIYSINGGAGKVLFDIVTNLNRDKFEPQVICFYKNRSYSEEFSNNIYLKLEKANMKIHYLFETALPIKKQQLIRKILCGATISYKLWKVIKQIDKNAILVPFLDQTAINLFITQNFGIKNKTIISLHTNETAFYKSLFPNKLFRCCAVTLLSLACRKANAVIFPSEASRTDFVKKFNIPNSKTLTIANPINIKEIVKLASEPLPDEISVPPTITMFCHVGRLDQEKNHLLLIKACDLLQRRYKNFIVLCAGSGKYEREIRGCISQEGLENHIKLVGNLANPYALMSKSRALVLTSRYEGFSLVLVEAMASGTICISVDCSFGPVEILSNGEFGLIVSPDDPVALSETMYDVIYNEELVKSLKEKGINRAREYSIEKIIKQWEALF